MKNYRPAGRFAAARRLQQPAAGAAAWAAGPGRSVRRHRLGLSRDRSRIWRRARAIASSSPSTGRISPRKRSRSCTSGRLAAALSECHRYDRRSLRRARHARVQSRPRRAPRSGGQECPGRRRAFRHRGSRRSAMARNAQSSSARTRRRGLRTACHHHRELNLVRWPGMPAISTSCTIDSGVARRRSGPPITVSLRLHRLMTGRALFLP